MTPQQLFISADKALVDVIEQIPDEQWSKKVPDYISPIGETLREIVNSHLYDEIWVPDTLAGLSIEQVGQKYDGDLLGKDPIKRYKAISAETQMIVGVFDELGKQVHLTYGDYAAKDYLAHITCFRALRAYDIGKFIGVDVTFSGDLSKALFATFDPLAADLRAMGVFGAEVKVSESADAQTKFLALTGRKI